MGLGKSTCNDRPRWRAIPLAVPRRTLCTVGTPTPHVALPPRPLQICAVHSNQGVGVLACRPTVLPIAPCRYAGGGNARASPRGCEAGTRLRCSLQVGMWTTRGCAKKAFEGMLIAGYLCFFSLNSTLLDPLTGNRATAPAVVQIFGLSTAAQSCGNTLHASGAAMSCSGMMCPTMWSTLCS